MSEVMKQEASRLLAFLTVSALLGWATGHPGWAFAAGFLAYIGLHLRQLERLQAWLRQTDGELPEAGGVWGEVFDGIHQLRRDSLRAKGNLLGIIQRARASVAALQEAVVLIDGDGNLEWWNPAAQRLLGLQTDTDTGQPVTNLIRDPGFIRYFEQGPYDEPLQLPSFIHPAHQLQFNVTRFGSNDRLLIVSDITRLHNLEQMRKDFVANVSHELRTPLTVLSGYLETLLAQQDAISPRWQRALQQMDAQAQRMNNLVNDLLLLSRLENESRRQEPTVVDVPALLRSLQSEALAFGHEKQQAITLDCDADLRLVGHEDELRSAFSNLVTNAVKYTPAGGRITLGWRADEGRVYFSVQDNGIGIDTRHIPRLTERFYRADEARSTATGGTGLGLAIVKHVLIDHEGHLDIQSSLGKGSTFTCSFPGRLARR